MTDEIPLDRNSSAPSRSMHLLGGRRVTVADLLAAGLIKAGTKLRFNRTRVGSTHEATVTESGRIRLEPDGGEFRSPSRAATVAAGIQAVDGWHAWQVVGQERFLDALRQELLDQQISRAAAAANQQDEDARRQIIHQRLKEARNLADSNSPMRVSVRELLGFWGAKERGDQVSQIEADLANHGLVTSPSFRAVTLDTMVSLTKPPEEVERTEAVESSDVDDLPGAEDDEGVGDLNVRLTVGNLSPLDGVTSVGPNSTFEEAITKMTLNDYSQLAVLSGTRNLRGAVSWQSITQAIHRGAPFSAAIIRHVEVVAYDRDLFDVLPMLRQREFVFVRDLNSEISGIITTADVAERYGEVATPFYQLSELDQTLRWVLGQVCDTATIQQLCNKTISTFNDLSIGDSQRLLENPAVWEKLGWPLDRGYFIERLREIRLIRNKVMHFHPDPVPDDAVTKLRQFNRLLHRYRDPV